MPSAENDAGAWRGLGRFLSWYFRSWFDFPTRRPYPETRPIPPAEQVEHDWKPTTNTLAVWKCGKCGAVGFDPRPLPRYGCVTPPASTEATR